MSEQAPRTTDSFTRLIVHTYRIGGPCEGNDWDNILADADDCYRIFPPLSPELQVWLCNIRRAENDDDLVIIQRQWEGDECYMVPEGEEDGRIVNEYVDLARDEVVEIAAYLMSQDPQIVHDHFTGEHLSRIYDGMFRCIVKDDEIEREATGAIPWEHADGDTKPDDWERKIGEWLLTGLVRRPDGTHTAIEFGVRWSCGAWRDSGYETREGDDCLRNWEHELAGDALPPQCEEWQELLDEGEIDAASGEVIRIKTLRSTVE
jgi:hypothetical protein